MLRTGQGRCLAFQKVPWSKGTQESSIRKTIVATSVSRAHQAIHGHQGCLLGEMAKTGPLERGSPINPDSLGPTQALPSSVPMAPEWAANPASILDALPAGACMWDLVSTSLDRYKSPSSFLPEVKNRELWPDLGTSQGDILNLRKTMMLEHIFFKNSLKIN